MDRRSLLGVLFTMAAGCAQEPRVRRPGSAANARLQARPGRSGNFPAQGLHTLELAKGRSALLYVPKRQPQVSDPMPLVVSLHGAGGRDRHGIDLLQGQADAFGVALLSPGSRQQTWDIIMDDFGPDVEFLDATLNHTFRICDVDPARLAIGGFSDGASYALTLGLANGDLFTNILAFSPGFTAHPSTTGKPKIFVSHGTRDAVLPIDRCSRRLVPRLRAAGYAVDYREFDGPHTVPADMSAAGVEQLVSSAAAG